MPDDVLAKWRRPGSPAASAVNDSAAQNNTAPRADLQPGAAVDSADGWLELRPLKGPWSLCSYGQLRKILYNGAKPTRIDLIFSFERVTLKGRGLETLLPGLRARTLGRIEQTGADGSTNPEVLLVESIESTDNGFPPR
jgi:hypothetical protein